MPELGDETYVRELFAKLFGIQLVKIPETDGAKTFDFELRNDGHRIAAVEVKRFERTPRTAENGWRCVEEDVVIDGKVVGKKTESHRNFDNAAARVGAMIHKAYKQLAAATDTRVLVFVNDETQLDVGDLSEAVNGYMVYGDKTTGKYKNLSSMKIAQGRILEEKMLVDLYVWIDRHREVWRTIWVQPNLDGTAPNPDDAPGRGPFFRVTSDAGYDLARRYFKMPECPCPETGPDADVPTLREMLLREAGVKADDDRFAPHHADSASSKVLRRR